uniref:Uncharacterized protein n=1 Tax=viral metagenome TaxID=1070528 RepID=A0A6M3LA13_9ZZZZ
MATAAAADKSLAVEQRRELTPAEQRVVDEVRAEIERRRQERRCMLEARYGVPMDDEPDEARFRRLLADDSAWSAVGGGCARRLFG